MSHGDIKGQVSSGVFGAKSFLETRTGEEHMLQRMRPEDLPVVPATPQKRGLAQLGWPRTFGAAGSGDEVCEAEELRQRK